MVHVHGCESEHLLGNKVLTHKPVYYKWASIVIDGSSCRDFAYIYHEDILQAHFQIIFVVAGTHKS